MFQVYQLVVISKNNLPNNQNTVVSDTVYIHVHLCSLNSLKLYLFNFETYPMTTTVM